MDERRRFPCGLPPPPLREGLLHCGDPLEKSADFLGEMAWRVRRMEGLLPRAFIAGPYNFGEGQVGEGQEGQGNYTAAPYTGPPPQGSTEPAKPAWEDVWLVITCILLTCQHALRLIFDGLCMAPGHCSSCRLPRGASHRAGRHRAGRQSDFGVRAECGTKFVMFKVRLRPSGDQWVDFGIGGVERPDEVVLPHWLLNHRAVPGAHAQEAARVVLECLSFILLCKDLTRTQLPPIEFGVVEGLGQVEEEREGGLPDGFPTYVFRQTDVQVRWSKPPLEGARKTLAVLLRPIPPGWDASHIEPRGDQVGREGADQCCWSRQFVPRPCISPLHLRWEPSLVNVRGGLAIRAEGARRRDARLMR